MEIGDKNTGVRHHVIPIKLTSLLIICATLAPPVTAFAKRAIEEATVKVYTISNSPDYDNPWSMRGSEASTGSGGIIDGNHILTNAHVVDAHTLIQVRRHGDAKRYPARVLHVAHEVDLALLTVDDPTFFSGVHPLQLGKLPDLQQEVRVYGFPLGGDTLSITKGVISRIEHQEYVHSRMSLLMVQIDAAINPGNSGGPAIVKDRLVGIAAQSIGRAQSIGYIVPTPVIAHFLKDIEDGEYGGFPGLGVELQDIANPAQRAKYGLPEHQPGALVTRVYSGSPADNTLKVNDILLAVDGHNVADGLSVEFRPKEWTSLAYFIQERQIGERVGLHILRQGTPTTLRITLDKAARDYDLVPIEFDTLPRYYIFGGLVFTPLTINYLQTWGDKWDREAPPHLLTYLQSNHKSPQDHEVVILQQVLASDLNTGYHDLSDVVITRVNGKMISGLQELISIVDDHSTDPYISFEDADGQVIVLNKPRVKETSEQLLATYHISHDRSTALLPAADSIGLSGAKHSVRADAGENDSDQIDVR